MHLEILSKRVTVLIIFRRVMLLKSEQQVKNIKRDNTHDATAISQILTYDGLDQTIGIGGGKK